MKEIAPGVVVDEKIKLGKPVIKGTRIPVDLILGKIASVMSFEEIMREYDIERRDILNAISYAAKLVEEEKVI